MLHLTVLYKFKTRTRTTLVTVIIIATLLLHFAFTYTEAHCQHQKGAKNGDLQDNIPEPSLSLALLELLFTYL